MLGQLPAYISVSVPTAPKKLDNTRSHQHFESHKSEANLLAVPGKVGCLDQLFPFPKEKLGATLFTFALC